MERSLSDPKLGEVRAVLERLQTFAADPDSTQPPHQASNGAALNGHATSSHKAGPPEAVAPVSHDSGVPVGKRRAPAAIGLGIASLVAILLGGGWLMVSPGNRSELSAAATPDVTAGRAISERDASVRDASIRDPSARDTPVRDPSVRDQSVRDQSVRDPSVRDPSMRDPSVKEPPPTARPWRAAIDTAQDLLARGHVQAARKQLLGLASADAADVAWMLARSYDPNYLVTLPSADGSPDVDQATRWYRIWHAAAVKQGLVPNSVSVERIIGSMR
jgi:hypothetical protein